MCVCNTFFKYFWFAFSYLVHHRMTRREGPSRPWLPTGHPRGAVSCDSHRTSRGGRSASRGEKEGKTGPGVEGRTRLRGFGSSASIEILAQQSRPVPRPRGEPLAKKLPGKTDTAPASTLDTRWYMPCNLKARILFWTRVNIDAGRVRGAPSVQHPSTLSDHDTAYHGNNARPGDTQAMPFSLRLAYYRLEGLETIIGKTK